MYTNPRNFLTKRALVSQESTPVFANDINFSAGLHIFIAGFYDLNLN